MARETAAEKKARLAAEEAQTKQPVEVAPEPPQFDGVIVVIHRGEGGDITGMEFATSGDVRQTEIGDILSLAEVVHARQIKG